MTARRKLLLCRFLYFFLVLSPKLASPAYLSVGQVGSNDARKGRPGTVAPKTPRGRIGGQGSHGTQFDAALYPPPCKIRGSAPRSRASRESHSPCEQ